MDGRYTFQVQVSCNHRTPSHFVVCSGGITVLSVGLVFGELLPFLSRFEQFSGVEQFLSMKSLDPCGMLFNHYGNSPNPLRPLLV